MEIQGLTDVGTLYKDNQDTFFVAKLSVNGTESCLLLLCDGMGGLEDGQFASQSVVSAIRSLLVNGTFSKDSVKKELFRVSQGIFEKYSPSNKCGTTCSMVFIQEGKYWGYHIGDSRIYHFRDKFFKLLTEDHTYLNLKRKRGDVITKEDEKKFRSTLSRCIGVNSFPMLDYIEGTYLDDDVFLVCSDGFWHHWDMNLSNLEDSISKAKSLGEKDNISVAMVKV